MRLTARSRRRPRLRRVLAFFWRSLETCNGLRSDDDGHPRSSLHAAGLGHEPVPTRPMSCNTPLPWALANASSHVSRHHALRRGAGRLPSSGFAVVLAFAKDASGALRRFSPSGRHPVQPGHLVPSSPRNWSNAMEVFSKHSSPFAFLVSGLGSDCVDRRHRRHGGWQRGEPAEGAAKRSTLLPMVEGEAWSIEERGTFTVHCDSGTLWVT